MNDYIERPEHEEFVKRMEEEHRRLNKRIGILEGTVAKISELTVSVNKMAVSIEHMVQEQKRQGEHLEKLEEVPADNWKTLRVGFLSAIGGAVAAGLIALLAITQFMK